MPLLRLNLFDDLNALQVSATPAWDPTTTMPDCNVMVQIRIRNNTIEKLDYLGMNLNV